MPKSQGMLRLIIGFSVLILMLAIIHMLGTHYLISQTSKSLQERFSNDLISPANMVVFQGSAIPLQPTPTTIDNDESLPSVDGTLTAPKSMFMMSYNKCDPSCCPSPYMCGGGCVCLTDDQKRFIGNRGNNSATRCPMKDNVEY